jgi:hypothetical protein
MLPLLNYVSMLNGTLRGLNDVVVELRSKGSIEGLFYGINN